MKLSNKLRPTVRVALFAGLLFFGTLITALIWRNHWPASVTGALAALRAKNVPTTLGELNTRYAALSRDDQAVAHFQKAFGQLPNGRLPLFEPRRKPDGHNAPLQFSPEMLMTNAAVQTEVQALIQTNAQALQLLHEGLNYRTCHFPIKITDGWNALLPHLTPCQKAATLLCLEAVYRARHNDPTGAVQSVSACLHLAEILRDEPTLVGFLVQDQIVAKACYALRACLDLAPLPASDLAALDRRIQAVLERDRLAQVLAAERCFVLSVFLASNTRIAEFVEQGPPKPMVMLGAEVMRWKGILQRDCTFYLQSIAGLEQMAKETPHDQMAAGLAQLANDVARNKNLARKQVTEVNIISDMTLPGCLETAGRHLQLIRLAASTSAALAVERYREAHPRLPNSLEELTPEQLPRALKDPLTSRDLTLRKTDPGYEILIHGQPDEVLLSVTR